MDPVTKKNLRKLVTLTPDLVDRVEKFRQSAGATSESEALKTLIEDGLRLRDKPADLFERCKSLTSISAIADLTADHPLVFSTNVDADDVCIYLKGPADAADERFRFSRNARAWKWEIRSNGYDNHWSEINKPAVVGRSDDLDDEIPF
jgi:hypothetical protein